MQAAPAPGGVLPNGLYFGRVVSRDRLAGFTLTETVYRQGEDLPPHAHANAFFCLTLAGGYAETTPASRETAYAPFTAVFHPAGEEHVTRMGPAGGRILNVEIDADRLQGLAELADPKAPVRDLGGGSIVWALDRFRRARGGPGDAALDAEALGAELLGETLRETRRDARPPAWLARLVERLHADGAVPSLAELAAEAGVHPVHVARAFRRFRGTSPGAYRRRLRLQRACRLLEDRAGSLAEVAAMAGFADQSHLTRALKRVSGVTPGVFRRSGGS